MFHPRLLDAAVGARQIMDKYRVLCICLVTMSGLAMSKLR
jgi:hypothetical protein